jgi:hypothetical protein
LLTCCCQINVSDVLLTPRKLLAISPLHWFSVPAVPVHLTCSAIILLPRCGSLLLQPAGSTHPQVHPVKPGAESCRHVFPPNGRQASSDDQVAPVRHSHHPHGRRQACRRLLLL